MEHTKLGDMHYQRPSISQVKERAAEILSRFLAANTAEEAIRRYGLNEEFIRRIVQDEMEKQKGEK